MQKTCTVQVFKTEETGAGSYSSDGTFGLTFKFAESQSSRHRSTKPFKTVREEFWLISWTSLLGNVGGTLGMFIGFCFIATFEWLAEKMNRLFSCFKSQESIAQMLFQ